ncbi:FadR/GntR family transcriptional regulator [Leifsonia sp. 22587]|uniref:FadR/GntR family transcriptional regulator n=1 Tax=Leifsonia sp. 22587 TaxID=3453946 RepID=UPI003F82B3A6
MTVFSKRGLQGQLVDTLGRRILLGELAEGQTIDLEGLESEFNVSRTVVREALRVLTAKGLLDARPRTGTFVLPRRNWKLLDEDVMLWRAENGLSEKLLNELDQLRRIIEPAAARLAALHRSEEDLSAIENALERMARVYAEHRNLHSNGLAEHVQADIDFHTALLRATANELVAHMDMSLRPILNFRDSLIPEGQQSEQFLDAHRAVLVAVKAQDADEAELAMLQLLSEAADDLTQLVNQQTPA